MVGLARIALVIFSFVTISHGASQRFVFHAQADHHADATVGHEGVTHSHDHVGGLVIPVVAAAHSSHPCEHDPCQPDSDSSGAHFHVTCCAVSLAILGSGLEVEPRGLTALHRPRVGSSLVLGDLRFPLLRPPSQLI